MATRLDRPDFNIFQCLEESPSDTVAFHAMLGIRYPTDIATYIELAASGRPFTDIVKEYAPRIAALARRGIRVERLILGPGPEDPGYEIFWALKRLVMQQVVEAGEVVHVAKLPEHRTALETMRHTSALADAHLRGIGEGVPQSSFWLVARPGEPALMWIMNYQRDPQTQEITFVGGPLYEGCNLERPVDDVERWGVFWRKVFETSQAISLNQA